MHAGGRFFGNAAPILHHLVPAIRILALHFDEQILDDLLFLACRCRFNPVAAFFELVAFVDEQRRVAAVIDDELRAFAVRDATAPCRCTTNILPASRPSTRRPARPPWRSRPRRDPASRKYCSSPSEPIAPRSTSVSINTAVWIVMCNEPVMRTPCERLRLRVLLADGHQARHFLFRDGDFFAAPIRQTDVGDFVILFRVWFGQFVVVLMILQFG